jgi:hypothetical protein
MLAGPPSGARLVELGKMLRSFIKISERRVVFLAIVSLARKLVTLSGTLKPRLREAILLRKGRKLARNVRLNMSEVRNRSRSVCISLTV